MLPVIVLPTWIGARLYRRISEVMFRRVVLWLLIASGVTLLVAAGARPFELGRRRFSARPGEPRPSFRC